MLYGVNQEIYYFLYSVAIISLINRNEVYHKR